MATLALVCIIISLLFAPLYIIYKPPNILVQYMQYKWPGVLFQVKTAEKVVALTIDDAPTQYTEGILALLKRYNATATFFVIGAQVDSTQRQDVLKAILEQGSELGNHAMHDEPSRDLSDAQLESEIIQVDGLIEEAYSAAATNRQRQGRYFRPGSGFFSRRMLALVEKMGYRLVLGGIYPHDPQIAYASLNARHILSMVRPGGIIICHDRRSWTIPMLEKVLPQLQERGYRVVSLSRLLSEES